MNEVSVLGIDLAKTVFQFHGVDDRGIVVLREQVKRHEMSPLLALPPYLISIKA